MGLRWIFGVADQEIIDFRRRPPPIFDFRRRRPPKILDPATIAQKSSILPPPPKNPRSYHHRPKILDPTTTAQQSSISPPLTRKPQFSKKIKISHFSPKDHLFLIPHPHSTSSAFLMIFDPQWISPVPITTRVLVSLGPAERAERLDHKFIHVELIHRFINRPGS